MLQDSFNKVYTKFNLNFYRKFFERVQDRDTSLTTVETFCMEIIYSINNPTVQEFARVAGISSPNAAYKVNNLIKKGYLRKVQSESDKREFHLEVTDKYLGYYNMSYQYIGTVMQRMEAHFTKEELATIENALEIMSEQLMPEIELGKKEI